MSTKRFKTPLLQKVSLYDYYLINNRHTLNFIGFNYILNTFFYKCRKQLNFRHNYALSLSK